MPPFTLQVDFETALWKLTSVSGLVSAVPEFASCFLWTKPGATRTPSKKPFSLPLL